MLLDGLNDAQLEAITETFDESCLVIAGPGAGKTAVLTRRIAYMIEEGIKARNILTVTFTNKAATEMKERIKGYIGDVLASDIWMGTYHSICVKILRRYANEIGLSPKFTIIDADEQKKIIKEVLKKVAPNNNYVNEGRILSRISTQKNKLLTPSDYLNTSKDYDRALVGDCYLDYQKRLTKIKCLDFDDLIMKTCQLLKQSSIAREYYQNKFKYILLDETQDSNYAQYQLVKLLAGNTNNIFAVTDDAQAIYSWRGADIQNLHNFIEEYNPKIIKLEQNYRSTQTVVYAGNAIIKNNLKQLDKTIFSKRKVGNQIKLYEAPTGDDEARFVADEIQNLVRHGGYNYDDIMVLYRTNYQSRAFEDKFMNFQIPYDMTGVFSFYGRKEVKDILAWLKIVSNNDDDLAMERILNTLDALGSTSIKNILSQAENFNLSAYDSANTFTCKQSKSQASLESAMSTLSKLSSAYSVGSSYSNTPVTDMLDLIWKNTSYYDNLVNENTPESLDRKANLDELISIAKSYELLSDAPDLTEFLENIALASTKDSENKPKSIKMMSVHASKGMESPIVFLVGMEENLFPHANSINTPEALEEERRLCYVGVTRAKDELYITYANARRGFKGIENNSPSRFIGEIPSKVLLKL